MVGTRPMVLPFALANDKYCCICALVVNFSNSGCLQKEGEVAQLIKNNQNYLHKSLPVHIIMLIFANPIFWGSYT
jgi:hypothetical protein